MHARCINMEPLTNLDAQKRAERLYIDLKRIVDRDPEQEVQGIALPVLDACLSAIRATAEKDPVLSVARDVISADTVADGEPVRAVDVLVVLGQISAVIGKPASAYFRE